MIYFKCDEDDGVGDAGSRRLFSLATPIGENCFFFFF